MNWTLVLELVTNILVAVVAMVLTTLVPIIKTYIEKKLSDMNDERLKAVIITFVTAAEQMLAENDPTGEKRKAYVMDQLRLLGIEITDYLNALIEQSVYENTFGQVVSYSVSNAVEENF